MNANVTASSGPKRQAHGSRHGTGVEVDLVEGRAAHRGVRFLFPFYYMIVGSLQKEPDSSPAGAFPDPGI